MNWVFFRAKTFYALMGLFGAVAIVAIVASLNRNPLLASFGEMRTFLEAWSRLVPDQSLKKVVELLGYPIAVLILGLFAYILDFLGDMTLPTLSSCLRHFNKPRVKWSIAESNGDWRKSKIAYRTVHEIEGDRIKWDTAKANLGKFSVRFFRTTVYIVFLLLIAGIIDISSSNEFRGRGIALIVIGLVGMPMSIALWGARYERYIDNLMSNLETNKSRIPKSYSKAIQQRK